MKKPIKINVTTRSYRVIYDIYREGGHNVHVNIIQGDFIFYDWKENGWKEFSRKEHDLRMRGFRKVNHEFDYLNLYVTYKCKKKRITLTMALS